MQQQLCVAQYMIVMELLLKELSENVLETLGKGQREAVYQRALSTALNTLTRLRAPLLQWQVQ